jgi:cytoskeletal protein RodZ
MKTILKKPIIMRKLIIIALVIIIFLASLIFIFLAINRKDGNKELTNQIDKTSSIKKEQVEGSNNNSKLPEKNPQSLTGSVSASKSNVETPKNAPEKPHVSRAEQTTSNEIKVVATLQEASAGYCELQISKLGSQTVTSESYVVVGPSYYTCSFTLPLNRLDSSGQWDVMVIHHIGGAQTGSEAKAMDINL